jgi:hypothetical protein
MRHQPRLIGFVRGLANDVANESITTNAALPGLMNTLATVPQSEEQKPSTWGTASHQAAGQTRGCDWRSSIFDNRRCCIHHLTGNCRRRRSVSNRLGPYLRVYGEFDRRWQTDGDKRNVTDTVLLRARSDVANVPSVTPTLRLGTRPRARLCRGLHCRRLAFVSFQDPHRSV